MTIDDGQAPDRLSLAMSRIEILRHLGAGSLESGIIVAALLDDTTVDAWTELQRHQRVTTEDAALLSNIGNQIREDLSERVAAECARRSAQPAKGKADLGRLHKDPFAAAPLENVKVGKPPADRLGRVDKVLPGGSEIIEGPDQRRQRDLTGNGWSFIRRRRLPLGLRHLLERLRV